MAENPTKIAEKTSQSARRFSETVTREGDWLGCDDWNTAINSKNACENLKELSVSKNI